MDLSNQEMQSGERARQDGVTKIRKSQAQTPTEQIQAEFSTHGLRQLPPGLCFFLSRKLLLNLQVTLPTRERPVEGVNWKSMKWGFVGVIHRQGLVSPDLVQGTKKSTGCCQGTLQEHSCSLAAHGVNLFLRHQQDLKKKKFSLGRHLVLLFPP